jgi:cbb3-type cytochrome oxidase maturation protein
MSVLFVLVPMALALAALAVAAFAWAARTGQLDDLETPALRILHDEAAPRPARPPPDRRETAQNPLTSRARGSRHPSRGHSRHK